MSFVRKVVIPDPKVEYPRTLKEAKQIIETCFTENNWDETEQKVFIESIGLKGTWTTFEVDKLKSILAEMIQHKMVLIKQNKEAENVTKK